MSGPTRSYNYDSNGNLIQKADGTDTWGYEWYADDRLARVTRNGAEQARFVYDGAGQRYQKTAGGVTTTYTYDGEDMLREQLTSGTTYRYVHGPGVDEPLARRDQAGASVFYHADHLGSIVKTTNDSGATVSTRRYDLYGNLEMGSAEGGYAYTGREWDPEANLYYYRARYYDATTARFLGPDPIGISGGINLYEYVTNNPLRFTDPLGLAPNKLMCWLKFTACVVIAWVVISIVVTLVCAMACATLPGPAKLPCLFFFCMLVVAVLIARVVVVRCIPQLKECLNPPEERKSACLAGGPAGA